MTETDAQARCKALLDAHRAKIIEIAHDTIAEGYKPEDFVVFCIETSDPEWGGLVAYVLDTFECEELTVGGSSPIVIGPIATREAIMTFHQVLPAITRTLGQRGKDGLIAVITVEGDASGLFLEKLEPKRLAN